MQRTYIGVLVTLLAATLTHAEPAVVTPLLPADAWPAATVQPEWLQPPPADERLMIPGTSALADIFAPLTLKQWWHEFYERRPVAILRSDESMFKSIADIATPDFLTKFLILKTATNGDVEKLQPPVSKDAIEQFWSEGKTVIAHEVQSAGSPQLVSILNAVAAILRIPASGNMYVSPAGTVALTPHWDWTDGIILQLTGAKRWMVCDGVALGIAAALPNYSSDQKDSVWINQYSMDELLTVYHRRGQSDLCTNFTMTAGSVLYMPRGTIHAPFTMPNASSAHITLALPVRRFSWKDALVMAVGVNSVQIALKAANTFTMDAGGNATPIQLDAAGCVTAALQDADEKLPLLRVRFPVWLYAPEMPGQQGRGIQAVPVWQFTRRALTQLLTHVLGTADQPSALLLEHVIRHIRPTPGVPATAAAESARAVAGHVIQTLQQSWHRAKDAGTRAVVDAMMTQTQQLQDAQKQVAAKAFAGAKLDASAAKKPGSKPAGGPKPQPKRRMKK